MKVHYDITQGTEEWLRIRFGKIGGTRAKGLFVESDTLALELMAERAEDYTDDDSFKSFSMLRGQELEPEARRRLTEYTGIEFLEAGWIDGGVPGTGISPDGVAKLETIQCEIKCPERKKHHQTCLDDVIPKEHIHQCLHAFVVNEKLESIYFCSFRPESKIKPMFVKELKLEDIVDIGITEKSKVWEDRGLGAKEYVANIPVLKSVREWAAEAREKAKEVNKTVDEMLAKLAF